MASLQQIAAPGFVRPRFDDGTFDDPLPLRDHFEERFLRSDAPPKQLALIGPRGSGLTTTLAWLHGLTEASPLRVGLTLKALLSDAARSLELLASGEGVLFLDTSVTPVAPRAWRTIRRLFSQGIPGHPGSLQTLRSARLVVTRPSAGGEPRPQGEWPAGLSNPERAYLSPWSDDDLLELLGSRPDYRDRRAELFRELRALPHARALLGRPRTARWLVEAALHLEGDRAISLGRLYGEVLARIAPSTRALLSSLRNEVLGARELQRLLTDPPRHLEEVVSLLELPRALANVLHDPAHDLVERAVQLGFLSADTLRTARDYQRDAKSRSLVAALLELGALSPGKLLALSGQVQPDLGQGTRVSAHVSLALPGLQHCLCARECLDAVRAGRPPATVRTDWFPYLREEIDAGIQRRLATWLREPESGVVSEAHEETLPRDAVAATLLWVSGATPPLGKRARPYELAGAHLAGVSVPGADLVESDLCRADLGQARLEGADLRRARLVRTRALNAVFDGADLSQAILWQARLDRASLRGVRLVEARATRCCLRGASLEGAQARGAWLDGCVLVGADLTRADFREAHLVECELEGTNLASASFEGARFLRLDLRQVKLGQASLRGAVLTRCALSGLDLRETFVAGARLQRCELAGTDLSGADLRGARLDECWAPGASFVGADLRDAQLLRVAFGGGEHPGADFRHADLRGATLHGTNLAGVDLRGAQLDERARAHARRSGAVL